MTPVKNRISEEAARWAVKIHTGTLTLDEQGELDAWIAADVRHEGALVRARAAWLDLDRLAALGAGRVLSTPQGAHELAPSPESPKTPGTREPPQPQTPQLREGLFARRRPWPALAASLGAVSLLAAIWLFSHPPANTYISGVGELRKVPLTDGSMMVLNTSTETRIQFDDSQRNVRLTSGEALFDVAKDPTRPFVVHTGNITVTAVGTAFAVRKESDDRVDVTVTEGVVEIRQLNATEPVQRITANLRATLGSGTPIRIEQTPRREVERRLAWRTGMLAFDNEPLSAAIAEFNRYSRRHIVIDDPALAARSITGIFRTTDIDGFAQTAATALNAEALNEGETIRIRSH